MTYIEFRKREIHIHSAVVALVIMVLGMAGMNIYMYATVSGMRHEVSKMSMEISRAEVKGADLKNEMYQHLDEASQESFLESRGYVLERTPVYNMGTAEVAAH